MRCTKVQKHTPNTRTGTNNNKTAQSNPTHNHTPRQQRIPADRGTGKVKASGTDTGTTTRSHQKSRDKNKLDIMCYNVENIWNHTNDSSLLELIARHDIIGLTETFLVYDIDFLNTLDNYNCIQKKAIKLSRQGRASGGLILLYKKELVPWIKTIEIDLDNAIALDIDNSWLGTELNVLVVLFYIHPTGSPYYNDKNYQNSLEVIEEFILDYTETNGMRHLVLGGDANSRIGTWTNNDLHDTYDDEEEEETLGYYRRSTDMHINSHGRKLIEVATCLRLVPIHGIIQKDFPAENTYHSQTGDSTIDHFLCSAELVELVSDFTIHDRIESRHSPISLHIGHKQIDPTPTTTLTRINKIIWDQEKAGIYLEALGSEDMQNELAKIKETRDVNEQSNLLKDLLTKAGQCMEKTFRIGGVQRTKKDWFDKECLELKKKTRRLFTSFKQARSRDRKERLKKEYHDCRAVYQNLIRSKRNEYKRNLYEQIELNSHNSSVFWGIIRKLRRNKKTMANIDIEQWKAYFEEVFNSNNGAPQGREEERENNVEIKVEDIDEEINEDEIISAIHKLKKGKAPGGDSIPPEFLKEAGNILVPYLKDLFNNIYDQGYFPVEWSKAIIVPILKKGPATNTESYRGIISVTYN